jgi:hypothetical protein
MPFFSSIDYFLILGLLLPLSSSTSFISALTTNLLDSISEVFLYFDKSFSNTSDFKGFITDFLLLSPNLRFMGLNIAPFTLDCLLYDSKFSLISLSRFALIVLFFYLFNYKEDK